MSIDVAKNVGFENKTMNKIIFKIAFEKKKSSLTNPTPWSLVAAFPRCLHKGGITWRLERDFALLAIGLGKTMSVLGGGSVSLLLER